MCAEDQDTHEIVQPVYGGIVVVGQSLAYRATSHSLLFHTNMALDNRTRCIVFLYQSADSTIWSLFNIEKASILINRVMRHFFFFSFFQGSNDRVKDIKNTCQSSMDLPLFL